jgi:hypothetical protein
MRSYSAGQSLVCPSSAPHPVETSVAVSACQECCPHDPCSRKATPASVGVTVLSAIDTVMSTAPGTSGDKPSIDALPVMTIVINFESSEQTESE